MKVERIAYNLAVHKNTLKYKKTKDVEVYEKDNSSYKVQIGEKFLEQFQYDKVGKWIKL
jgi:hypothetical protein